MISHTAAEAAILTAQEFDRRRIVLEPVAGTPLASLVAASAMTEVAFAGQEEYLPDAALIVQLASGFAEDGVSRHDQELDAFATEIATAVANHLNYAKNVVRPVIAEVVEAVTADIAALPLDVQFNLDIVRRTLPAPMVSPAIRDLVDEFAGTPYDSVNGYIPLGGKSSEEIIELLMTGAADTDEALAAWAAQKGPEFLQRVWNAVFGTEPGAKFEQVIQDDVEGLDAALVIFLLCKKLYNNPPEGVTLSLVDYNQQIADIRNQCALRVIHGYESQSRDLRAGKLVERLDSRSITVNAEVFDAWKNAGGSDAVLFGAALSDRPVRFAADLNARADEFKALWEQRNRMLTAKERNERYARYTTILRERTAKIFGDNMATIFAALAPQGGQVTAELPQYQEAIRLLNEFVDNVREGDFKDLWSLVTKLVCRSAFHYTDAEKILVGIDQACKDNDGIEIREAALISTIEYVVDYVCDQIGHRDV